MASIGQWPQSNLLLCLIKELGVGPCVPNSCLVILSQSHRILGKPPVLFTDLTEGKENWPLEPMSMHDISARLHIDIPSLTIVTGLKTSSGVLHCGPCL